MDWLMVGVSAFCAVTAVGLVVEMVRNQQPGGVLLDAIGLLAASILVVTVWGIVRLFGDRGDVLVWEYVGYLLLAPLMVPIGIVWSMGEKSRGGTAVLLVAVVTVPFLFLRLHDIWAAGA